MYTQLKKTRKISCLLLAIMFLAAMFLPIFSTLSEASEGADTGILRILEIQPSTSSDITSSMQETLETFFHRKVEITKMPMPLFISKADEVNGYYDIVYIGNNTEDTDPYKNYYKGNVYSRFGPQVNNNCNVASSVSGNKEFYNGNDISNIAASKLKSFIEAGQLMIFDNGIFAQGQNSTKLYANFNGYRNNAEFNNVKVGNTVNLLNNLKEYKSQGINKRPSLQITNKPVEYNGNNIVANNGMISFAMNLNNNNGTQAMNVKLYIDRNGDGVFKDDEIAQTYENIGNIDGFSINYLLPSKYTGLIPWKLEVIDNCGVKAYETGFTAFKGDEQQIRVLQLLPDNNDNYATLKLSSLSNYNGKNLLYKSGEYRITITEMKISAFNNNYGNNVDGKPTILNGNYDMVIFGFDDAYVGDLSGNALNAMIAFADSGQAIMFTHDTVGFRKSNLTSAFKDRLGMNVFATDSAKPAGISVSTGMTRLALLNANGGARFPDTVLTCKINESNITKYPFILDNITVSPTHLQYLRLNPEDSDIVTAFTYRNQYIYNHGSRTATLASPLKNEDMYHEYDGFNDYYTYFKGNLTFSGTGHSPITSIEELKMFVNTMLKASVGSNHAPSAEILGLNNGQDIANTLDTLNFSVRASDQDIDDNRLNGKLYIDNDGDGIYGEQGESAITFGGTNALERDVERAVSIAKNVASSVTKFGIKVVVTDSSGAQGFKEISINNKNTPVLNMSHDIVKCLVGDRPNMGITVSAHGTGFSTTYKNLALTMNLNTAAFKSLSATRGSFSGGNYSYSLNDVIFNTNLNYYSEQSDQISFLCNQAGLFNTTASLSYKDGIGVTRTVNDPVAVNVKTGTVSVELKDNEGKAIKQEIILKKYNLNQATGKYLQDSSFTPLTADTDATTGIASFTMVPTGYYGATIALPSGYKPVDVTASLENNVQLTKMGDFELNFIQNTMVITLPVLYQVPIITISGNNTMVIWSKQKLTAAVGPDEIYGDWKVNWQVVPVTENGVVSGDAVIDANGLLTAKKLGRVIVRATTVDMDAGGQTSTITKEIEIIKNNVDIN